MGKVINGQFLGGCLQWRRANFSPFGFNGIRKINKQLSASSSLSATVEISQLLGRGIAFCAFQYSSYGQIKFAGDK